MTSKRHQPVTAEVSDIASLLHDDCLDETARRVLRSTRLNVGVALAALAAVCSLPAQPIAQGWVGAVGAALVFGGSSLPAKHPAAAAAGPLAFQCWVTVGNAGLNVLLLLLLRVPLQWCGWGIVGALARPASGSWTLFRALAHSLPSLTAARFPREYTDAHRHATLCLACNPETRRSSIPTRLRNSLASPMHC